MGTGVTGVPAWVATMASEPGRDLIVPGSGELVNLEDLNEVARALRSVKELEGMLKAARQVLHEAVRYHSQVLGKKTMRVAGGKLEVRKATDTIYDAESIERELRQLGMPEERIREIVIETVTYRVSAQQAKYAAAANPDYRAVIESNTRTVEKIPSVLGP